MSDCLGRREFGKTEMQQAVEFFGPVPPECVFCGTRPIARWDHLVPIVRGGETVLGNMVPACSRCDDSKQHRPYAEWMRSEGDASLKRRGVRDIEARIQKLAEYARHFGYEPTPLEQRLNEAERARLAAIRQNLDDARRELESLIKDARDLRSWT